MAVSSRRLANAWMGFRWRRSLFLSAQHWNDMAVSSRRLANAWMGFRWRRSLFLSAQHWKMESK
jgi:hypothetical protein